MNCFLLHPNKSPRQLKMSVHYVHP